MPAAVPAQTARELKERIEAERRGVPFVIFRDQDGRQTVLELSAERLSVGRSETADLSLSFEPQVSRLHAELERLDDDWVVADDGLSRNGSFVNEERVIGRRRLRDGDVLRFGAVTILFRSPSQAPEETAPASGEPDAETVTAAQRRVLVALCRPLLEASDPVGPATNQQVAAELTVGIDAVKANLRALFETFGLTDLPQNQKRIRLAELALRRGIVSARDLAA